jgi:hypothetical protein
MPPANDEDEPFDDDIDITYAGAVNAGPYTLDSDESLDLVMPDTAASESDGEDKTKGKKSKQAKKKQKK